jgi:hypothetical protein
MRKAYEVCLRRMRYEVCVRRVRYEVCVRRVRYHLSRITYQICLSGHACVYILYIYIIHKQNNKLDIIYTYILTHIIWITCLCHKDAFAVGAPELLLIYIYRFS